jgi:hypothetical protein
LKLDGVCHATNIAGGKTNCGPAGANNTCPGGSLACNASLALDSPTPMNGSCTPSPQAPTVPPFSWSDAGRACQTSSEGGGCGNGFACLPDVAAPFIALCISKPGNNTCPAGSGYTTKHVYYDAEPLDDRGCSDCKCSDPNGQSCTVTLYAYDDPTCGNWIGTMSPGLCTTIFGNPSVGSYKSYNTQIASGSCTPDGGMPKGSASGQNAVTFCCQ